MKQSVLLLLALMLAVCGCGDSRQFHRHAATITGTVKLDGEPLVAEEVSIQTSSSYVFSAKTDIHGKYKLEGVLPGSGDLSARWYEESGVPTGRKLYRKVQMTANEHLVENFNFSRTPCNLKISWPPSEHHRFVSLTVECLNGELEQFTAGIGPRFYYGRVTESDGPTSFEFSDLPPGLAHLELGKRSWKGELLPNETVCVDFEEDGSEAVVRVSSQ